MDVQEKWGGLSGKLVVMVMFVLCFYISVKKWGYFSIKLHHIETQIKMVKRNI